MRPRFMNRGSDPIESLSASRRPRFNEAPIHESGKSHSASKGPTLHWCFNEAPIHESGKFSRLVTSGFIAFSLQ